jgi:predicted chitinase
MEMTLAEAEEILTGIDDSIPTREWNDEEITTAIQRALAEVRLLNPADDVDGKIGPRTRNAWKFFKEATEQTGFDTIEAESAARLIQTMKNPADLIGKLQVDLQPDFPFYRKKGAANREQSVAALIAATRERELTNEQIAYVLATAEHESANFNFLEEIAAGTAYEGREDLGNLYEGDGPLFKGRGYVQLTGRTNYEKYAKKTGIELVTLPIILMNWPALSVYVIIDGMMNGVYTGKRLDRYVNSDGVDFINARRVVNGVDCADAIAAKADAWLEYLG